MLYACTCKNVRDDDIDELVYSMEKQLENQNLERKELKKQIETLSLLQSQLPHYLNAVVEYI